MKHLLIITILLGIVGCEAPLVLDGVETNKASSVRRTDVFMAASDNGKKSVIVGSEGLIILADSGKDNWSRHNLETKSVLIDITSCPNNDFAVLSMEGDIVVSKDDGQNWNKFQLPSPEIPQAITCNSNNVIWVVGSFSTIFSSEDAGKSWKDHSLNEDMILSTIQFLDDSKAIITGEFGTVLLTDDGGNTWEFADPIPNEFFPLASIFNDDQQGWVTGLSGIVYSTKDGGVSWKQEETHIKAPLFGISINDNDVIAVGDNGTVIHKDLNTPSNNWEKLEVPIESRFFFRVISPIKDNKLIIAGGAGSLELVDLSNVNLMNVEIN